MINKDLSELLIFNIDLKLLEKLSIPDKKEPMDIEVNENDHSVYVITENNFYKQYNDTQMIGLQLKSTPRTLEVNENNNMVYVISDHDVSIINGTTRT